MCVSVPQHVCLFACVPCGSSHQTSPLCCLLWPLNAASQPAVHSMCVYVCACGCVCVCMCVSLSEQVAKGSSTLCCKSKPHQPCLSLLIIFIQAARRSASGMWVWSLPFWLLRPLLRATLTLTTLTAACLLMNQVGGWMDGGGKEGAKGQGGGQKKHVVPRACGDSGGER